MTLHAYLGFVVASVLLILLPGPNVAVIVANSVRHGMWRGLATVAGTTSAAVIQIGLVIFGLAGVIGMLAGWLDWIKWLGVAYLVWLAVAAWRAPPATFTPLRVEGTRGLARSYMQGFLVSLTNPKTMLFYSAFLPQFVSSSANARHELLILGATFVTLALLLDSVWALAANRLRPMIERREALLNRATGALFMTAAIAFAFTRRP
ncbi:MAG: LysE family translocator [Hyphomicrobiaceae bacterium]